MSFILDALKKSENERQRQIGPSLADAPVRRQRVDRPWWAIAVAILLVINLGVLVVVLARDDSADAATAVRSEPPPQATPLAPPTRAASTAVPAGAPVQYATPSPARVQPNMPGASVSPPQMASPAVRSLADEAGVVAPLADEVGALDPALASAAAVPEGPPLVRPIEAPSVAPLPNAPTFAARSNPNVASASGSDGSNSTETLPTHSALVSSGSSLPDLKLDIHVYATNAAERFVFVNMHRYSEGQTMSEGPSVERITADGVILNQSGLRFLLPRQ